MIVVAVTTLIVVPLAYHIVVALQRFIRRWKLLRMFARNDKTPEVKLPFGIYSLHTASDHINKYPFFEWCCTFADDPDQTSKKSLVPGLSYQEFLPSLGLIICENLDVAEKIWDSPKHHLQKGLGWRVAIEQINGDCLISMGSVRWRKQRRLLAPSFHTDLLSDYMERMNDNCRIMTGYLDAKILKSGSSIFFREFAELMIFDIVADCIFGVPVDAQKKFHDHGETPKMFDLYQKIAPEFSKRIHPIYCYNWVWKLCNYQAFTEWQKNNSEYIVVIKALLEERRSYLSNGEDGDFKLAGKRKLCIVDTLLQRKQEGLMDEKSVIAEISQFIFAAFDTSIAVLPDGLAYLAHITSTEYFDKLQIEVDEVFQDMDEIEVTQAHLSNMPYLDLVAREILRMCAPAPVITREVNTPVVVNKNITIPFDESIPVEVLLPIRFMMRSKTYFGDDADEFCPERFLRPDIDTRAEMAFSMGPRNCIGKRMAVMQLKVELIHVISKFTVRCTENLRDRAHMSTPITRFENEPVLEFFRREEILTAQE